MGCKIIVNAVAVCLAEARALPDHLKDDEEFLPEGLVVHVDQVGPLELTSRGLDEIEDARVLLLVNDTVVVEVDLVEDLAAEELVAAGRSSQGLEERKELLECDGAVRAEEVDDELREGPELGPASTRGAEVPAKLSLVKLAIAVGIDGTELSSSCLDLLIGKRSDWLELVSHLGK